MAARDKLANARQISSVTDYVDHFQDILLDLPKVSDDEILDRFVRGLKDNVRIHVLTKEPQSWEEATRYAISYESANKINGVVPTYRQDMENNDPMDLSLLVQQLNAIVKPNIQYQHQDRRNIRPNRRSNALCHWCDKPGHFVADCRTRLREIREFEQERMKQRRNNNRQYNQRQISPNRLYNAKLVDVDSSKNSFTKTHDSDFSSFDSDNKDSVLDFSPYFFDLAADMTFLNTAITVRDKTVPMFCDFVFLPL
ncbi:hypothetical protein RMATCC62417_18246 [Rhizopus microsporus]|nr:hypothetical protein RMATCC62417_18246 [Rhizopus microsporus]